MLCLSSPSVHITLFNELQITENSSPSVYITPFHDTYITPCCVGYIILVILFSVSAVTGLHKAHSYDIPRLKSLSLTQRGAITTQHGGRFITVPAISIPVLHVIATIVCPGKRTFQFWSRGGYHPPGEADLSFPAFHRCGHGLRFLPKKKRKMLPSGSIFLICDLSIVHAVAERHHTGLPAVGACV